MTCRAVSSLAVSVCAAFAVAQEPETIFHNGAILTMNDAVPRVEAVAVAGGRIVAVGAAADLLATKGTATRVVDLEGKALLPGFVDAHGHVTGGGMQALSANLLAPPDGTVDDIAALQAALRRWAEQNAAAVAKVRLILGFGYDNAQLAELRHPTREDLDAVSTDVPVLVLHQSGHIVAANSKALEEGGITADMPDPDGGVIRRLPGSREPDGVLEETAAFPLLLRLVSRIGAEGALTFARAGADLWASFGYTTAQDGRSTPGGVATLQAVADAGGFPIDVVAYPDVLVDREFIARNVSRTYRNRFRVGGAKLTIDGSPQGFTAWRDRPYHAPVGDYPPGYKGYPAATAEQVSGAIDWAFANGIQLLTHSNGEAASDQLLAFVEAATKKYGAADRRPVLIHGQFLREDQVDDLRRLAVIPSLFPMHTYYWGDWHRDHTVGPVLADDISPTGWCVERGMRFTTHHDAPVAFPDSMRVLDATVTRRSRSGDILGPHHRVDVTTALKAMTLWAAWQHFEEDQKGSIEPGKLADLVVLDKDPTAVDPERLDEIVVLETIKEGVRVYARSAAKDRRTGGADALDRRGRAFAGLLASASRPVPGRLERAMQARRAAAGVGDLPCNTCLCGSVLQLVAAMTEGGVR